ncbi:alpha/beta hydrolase family protein [Caulobacter sp. DWR1-3-2b1]|uniref:alpha/beta hydrolase family protein n=1 Tax=Caulobacter sp. DWR1-3-2b1 TaxID=2804670 RepID=UPI003CFACA26
MGDRKVRAVSWIGDSHVVIQVSSTVGISGVAFVGEYFQALSLNAKTGAIVQLPNGSQDSVLNVMWETPYGGVFDGKPAIWAGLFAKEAFADEDGHYDLYRMDPDTGIGRRHQMGDKDTGSYLARSDGTVLARTKFRLRDGRWSLDLRRDGSWTEAYSTIAPLDQPSIAGLTYDETAVMLSIWDASAKNWSMAPVSSADGKLGAATTPKGPYSMITDRESRIIGSSYEDVYREYDFTEPRIKAAWPQVRQVFVGRQVMLSAHTHDFAKLVVYVEGTGEPGGYYLVDLGAKKVKRIGAAYPGLTGADIAQVQAVTYRAADGLEIEGYLTLPSGKAAKDLPLIVVPHGGPQARDSAGFDWWAQAPASRGYAVLQPNFRGSSGYGRAFTEAGYGEWGGKMQTDLSDGVRMLAKAGTIDPKRVCIVGASYGGYAALAGITLDKGVYRCSVAVAGVSDMSKMLAREVSQGGHQLGGALLEALYGRSLALRSKAGSKIAGKLRRPGGRSGAADPRQGRHRRLLRPEHRYEARVGAGWQACRVRDAKVRGPLAFPGGDPPANADRNRDLPGTEQSAELIQSCGRARLPPPPLPYPTLSRTNPAFPEPPG